MRGVSLRNRLSVRELRSRLGIVAVLDVVGRGRLTWFGHLERKNPSDWVSSCRNVSVVGDRRRGRPQKTWQACVNKDMKGLGLCKEMAQD